MLERVKSLLNLYSTSQEKKNHQLFSLMKSILCAEIDLMVKMKHQEESKRSFWFKCKVLAMMILVCLFWELQICHGLLILLLEEDSREEFIFLSQNMKLD